MNPHNVGEHIPLRHSSLWRKPLLYERPQKVLPQCHLQLNELGTLGFSWTSRNNAVQLNSTIQQANNRPRTATAKSEKRDKPTQADLQMSQESQTKSRRLTESMAKQKQENLTQARSNYLTLAAYPAVGRSPFVINDYHSRLVNPGYVRNAKGKHFAH